MKVNLWIAMRKTAQDVLKVRLKWDSETKGEYTGPVREKTAKLFQTFADYDGVQRLFKERSTMMGMRKWNIWSVYIEASGDDARAVRDEIDRLVSEYGNQIAIVGAWHMDGREVGTRYEDGKLVGFPIYPIPLWVDDFMPDVWSLDENDEPISTPASGPVDVNLLLGQSPRTFS